VSQNRHEVYLTVAEYDAGYIRYLKDEIDVAKSEEIEEGSEGTDTESKDAEARSFLKMRSFGPWNIYVPSHVNQLASILLAFTIKASQAPAS
jgi:hypothetical protein